MIKRRDFLHYSATAAATLITLNTAFAKESKPKLQFVGNGKFKIAQFTDTHYRIDRRGDCIDAVRLIEETLDAEKPQLAV